MSHTGAQTRTILTDATVLATYADQALQALHDNRGGYPASTPGAATRNHPNPTTTPRKRQRGPQHDHAHSDA